MSMFLVTVFHGSSRSNQFEGSQKYTNNWDEL